MKYTVTGNRKKYDVLDEQNMTVCRFEKTGGVKMKYDIVALDQHVLGSVGYHQQRMIVPGVRYARGDTEQVFLLRETLTGFEINDPEYKLLIKEDGGLHYELTVNDRVVGTIVSGYGSKGDILETEVMVPYHFIDVAGFAMGLHILKYMSN